MKNVILLRIINYLAFPVENKQNIVCVKFGQKILFNLKEPINERCASGCTHFIELSYIVYFKRTINLLRHKIKGDYK